MSLRDVLALVPRIDGWSNALDAYAGAVDQMAAAFKAAEDPTAGSASTGSTSSAGGALTPILDPSAGSAATGSQDTR